MAFKCIAARPCDSHGVISWEHPPPLISLMDYNNRKSAWPATSHLQITVPSLTYSIYLYRNTPRQKNRYAPSPCIPPVFICYINNSHLSVTTVKFNLSISVLVWLKNWWHCAHCCWRWWRARCAAAWHWNKESPRLAGGGLFSDWIALVYLGPSGKSGHCSE